MAFSISGTGKTAHYDMELNFDQQWASNFGTLRDDQRSALKQAINSAIAAISVDRNNTHNKSYTIQATLTTGSNASCSVTVS